MKVEIVFLNYADERNYSQLDVDSKAGNIVTSAIEPEIINKLRLKFYHTLYDQYKVIPYHRLIHVIVSYTDKEWKEEIKKLIGSNVYQVYWHRTDVETETNYVNYIQLPNDKPFGTKAIVHAKSEFFLIFYALDFKQKVIIPINKEVNWNQLKEKYNG